MPEVVDSVYVLPTDVEFGGNPRRFNPTAVETDSGLVLLDVGLPDSIDQLEEGLAGSDYGLADVELIVLTHHDGDHVSGLSTLLRRTEALVAAHGAEAPYVDGREFPIKTPDDQGRYEPAPVDVELVGGETIRTSAGPMELIHTPGHSPGHLSAYLSDAKVLITADAMVVEDSLSGPKEVFTPDMETAVESLGSLADLDVETVICFHGGPVQATGDDIAEIYSSLQA